MSSAPSHSPEKKDSDFFTEHTQVSAHKERFRDCSWQVVYLSRLRSSAIMGMDFIRFGVIQGMSGAY